MQKLLVVAAFVFCTAKHDKVHHDGDNKGVGDEGAEVTPKIAAQMMKTILPAMPKVPLISEKYWPVIKQVTGLEVEYKYFYDYDTKKTTFTTKEQREALGTMTITGAAKPTWGSVLTNAASEALFMLLIAWLYKSTVVDKRKPLPEGLKEMETTADFKTGLFDCFSNMNLCCLACCCAPVRAADTIASIGALPYWNVIGMWVAFTCLVTILPALNPNGQDDYMGLYYAGLAGIFFQYRHALRKKLGHKQDAGMTMQLSDVCTWMCCQFCAIAQEARVVDGVSGEEPACPFCSGLKVTRLEREGSTQPLVGNPVSTNN